MWSGLSLLALLAATIPATAQAFDDDIVRALMADDDASLSSLGFTPLGRSDAAMRANEEIESKPRWACDLRAWTRAPDLSPGAIIPGEARLAANGSACGDIVGWQVGLRFKERAFVKKKSANASLPAKPTRPAWNATARPHHDWNDVFSPTDYWSGGSGDVEYDQAVKEYTRLMAHEELWELKGHERVVFDIIKEMDFDPAGIPNVDIIEEFTVLVPWTNFPPIEEYPVRSVYSGKDEQMVGTETLSEYYHLVQLSNGSTIDIPSGRSGFIPLASPVVSTRRAKDDQIPYEVQWPLTVTFAPTAREPEKSEGDFPWHYHRIAPECDRYNQANFTLFVSSNVTKPTLGSNIFLNFTLIRTGNGTEYPAYIDIHHSTEKNLTYAWDQVESEEEYLELISEDSDKGRIYHTSLAYRMLTVPNQASLEKRRKMEEESRNGVFTSYSSGHMGMPPVGDNEARYEFWTGDGFDEKDKFEFGLELPLHYSEFPSFEKTFETVKSILKVTLHTGFACQLQSINQNDDNVQDQLGSSALDDEWTEYKLPPTKGRKRQADWSNMPLSTSKTASIPIHARLPLPSNETQNAEPKAVHYLDPEALAPVITDASTTSAHFPLLNQHWREEETDEKLKKRKWEESAARSNGWCLAQNDDPFGMINAPRCWSLNGGGGAKHAAKMWQAREAKRVSETSRQQDRGGLVVQV